MVENQGEQTKECIKDQKDVWVLEKTVKYFDSKIFMLIYLIILSNLCNKFINKLLN